MPLVRWSPRDMLSARDEMNRLVYDFFGRGIGEEGTSSTDGWTPPVDIYETADALIMKAELPGFPKENVSVEVKDNMLILRGERKREGEVKEEHYHRVERAYGAFHRSFLLPTTVDQERVKATYKDGVLELRLPKVEAAKPKRIDITG